MSVTVNAMLQAQRATKQSTSTFTRRSSAEISDPFDDNDKDSGIGLS